jgi:hypothetical protein
MSSTEAAPLLREPVAAALGRATGLAALCGAAIGLLESAKVLATSDARYVQWAARLVSTGALGYALVAALLALPCALFALALFGRPQFRAAPASTCAALGSALSVALFALAGWVPAELALPCALAATAVMLALKEILAWWPLATRVATWWSLLGLGSAACIALVAVRFAEGPVQWLAGALALANLGLAIASFRGRRAPHAATLGGLARVAGRTAPSCTRDLERRTDGRAAREHRHAARRCARVLRQSARADADDRRARGRRRAVRGRDLAGEHHRALARDDALGPLPDRAWRRVERPTDLESRANSR